MRSEEEYEKHVEKTKYLIKEAFECVIDQIGLGGSELPVTLDFSIRSSGIGINVSIFEYDI